MPPNLKSRWHRSKIGLTFDDVLILPEADTTVDSRSQVDISSDVTKNINCEIPVIASPMTTVTGHNMCISMAYAGGLGVLPRYQSLENLINESRSMSEHFHISDFEKWGNMFGIGIGLQDCENEIATLVFHLGWGEMPGVIFLDLAHGGMRQIVKAVAILQQYKTDYDFDLVVGNVATKQGVQFLYDLGVDAIRLGVGNGSSCRTRLITGIGVPQATALLEARKVVSYNSETKIICDGGFNHIGDIAKSLALGANAVMTGKMLTEAAESPGWKMIRKDHWEKEYVGMAKQHSNRVAEGVEHKITHYGALRTVKEIMTDIKEGLQSSYSYVGAKTTKEFYKKSKVIQVSQNTKVENGGRS